MYSAARSDHTSRRAEVTGGPGTGCAAPVPRTIAVWAPGAAFT